MILDSLKDHRYTHFCLHHKFLNDFVSNPTAENLSQYIFDKAETMLKEKNLTLKTLELWENEDSACIIRK